MIRLLITFLAIFLLAGFAAFVADLDGQITVTINSQIITVDLALLVAAIAALCLVTGLSVGLYNWIRQSAPIIGRSADIKRQSKGFKKLNAALVAMAAGDHALSRRLVSEAEALLPPQPMVHLLAAEGALRAGDTAGARERFAALEQTDDGRFLGLRGLLTTARSMGREAEALTLARAAFDDRPNSPWVLETLFALEVAVGHWAEATTVLDRVARTKLLDKDTVARHRGALLYGEAVERQLQGDTAAARKLFKMALSKRPGFAPATAQLARLEQADGKTKSAVKMLKQAWQEGPFPSIKAAYKALDVTESRAAWLVRAQALANANPVHPASQMLVAEAALAADNLEEADKALTALELHKQTRPLIKLKLDRAHKSGQPVDALEAALAHAPDGEGWVCAHCGTRADVWSLLCDSCGTFDSLNWTDTATQPLPALKTPEASIILLTEDRD